MSSLSARWWTRSGKRQDGETLPRSHQLKVIVKKISIFDNGLHYRGCALPLLLECLEHPWNSSTRLVVYLVHRVKKLFGPKCKLTMLADWEFLGNDWFKSLKQQEIQPLIRLRKNTLLTADIGKKSQVQFLFRKLKPGKFASSGARLAYGVNDVVSA